MWRGPDLFDIDEELAQIAPEWARDVVTVKMAVYHASFDLGEDREVKPETASLVHGYLVTVEEPESPCQQCGTEQHTVVRADEDSNDPTEKITQVCMECEPHWNPWQDSDVTHGH